MKSFKNIVLASILTLSFSVKAAVAFVVPNPDFAALVFMGGLATAFQAGPAAEGLTKTFGKYIGGILNIGLGIIVMDEDSGSITFSVIPSGVAEELELTQAEIAIYESELEEANIILKELASVPSDEYQVVWSELKENLSDETLSVINKVVTQASK